MRQEGTSHDVGRAANLTQPRDTKDALMREYKIAAIPADGIGPEVIEAGRAVLGALSERTGDISFKFTQFDWGSDWYKKHGKMMPDDGLDQLRDFNAIYFGAVGAPDVPDHITLWGITTADLPGV